MKLFVRGVTLKLLPSSLTSLSLAVTRLSSASFTVVRSLSFLISERFDGARAKALTDRVVW